MKKNITYLLLIQVCLLFAINTAIANPIFYNANIQTDSIYGFSINANGANVDVGADQFPVSALPGPTDITWRNNGYRILKSDGKVILRLEKPSNECLPNSFSTTLTVRVIYYKWNPSIPNQTTNQIITETKTLTIDYSTILGKSYKEKDVLNLEWAHYVKVEVLQVSNPSVSKYLVLEAEIEQERYKDVTDAELDNTPIFSTTPPPSFSATSREIWIPFQSGSNNNDVSFAMEFDFEWTFIEAYNDDGTNIDVSKTPTQETFRFNSSRITVKNKEVILNAIAEKGYLAYRVRAVTWYPNAENVLMRIECHWSPVQILQIHSTGGALFDEQEPKLNWQYVATYAEEGKTSESVTYFDGSMRQRQSNTKVIDEARAEKFIIVQDKIYDHQGRLAVEVLPTPIKSSALKFYASTSIREGSSPTTPVQYSKLDFDLDATACNTSTAAMSTSFGAAKYYSHLSDWASTSETNFQNYVPVAAGFPFIQTVYTPDNTGRVAKKSGVGETFKIGSGKETEYKYLRPNQPELDRLFGMEAGLSKHYQKNVVVDPNGQRSVSYMNAKGQVVATALAGKEPNSLNVLNSYQGSQFNEATAITVDLIKESSTYYSSDALIADHKFTVHETSDYKFLYSLNTSGFNPECVPAGYCIDCVYDLEISIINECNVEQLNFNQQPNTLIKRTIGSADNSNYASCATSSNPDYEIKNDFAADGNGYITLSLNKGEYTIRKKLTPNKLALEFYTDKYLKDQNCKTYETFLSEARSQLDFSGCNITCEQCYAKLLGLESITKPTEAQINTARIAYINQKRAELTTAGITIPPNANDDFEKSFDRQLENCQQMCDADVDQCEAMKDIMQGDMKPGGQYAKFKEEISNNGVLWVANDEGGTDTWNVLGSNITFSYKNTNKLTEFDDANYPHNPMINNVVKKVSELSVHEYIKYFDNNWLDVLVRLHPEYCKYEQCIYNKASADYTMAMQKVMTYDEAKDENEEGLVFLKPFTQTTSLPPVISSTDPFFSSSASCGNTIPPTATASMANRFFSYRATPQYLTTRNSNGEIVDLRMTQRWNKVTKRIELFDPQSNTPRRPIGYINTSGFKRQPIQNDDILDAGGALVGRVARVTLGAESRVLKWKKVVKNPNGTFLRDARITYSMYDMPVIDLYCSHLSPLNDVNQFKTCVDQGRAKIKTECLDVKDTYWQMFKAIYISNKNYLENRIQNDLTSGSCACPIPSLPGDDQGLVKKRELRFYPSVGGPGQNHLFQQDPRIYNPSAITIQEMKTQGYDGIATACDEQCNSYVDYWISKLDQCDLTPLEKAAFADELRKVCKNGCDINNPMGASSVAPQFLEGGSRSGEAPYKSFHDVFKRFGGGKFVAKICDDIFITSPKPYGHDYFSYDSPDADTCSCNPAYYSLYDIKGNRCGDLEPLPATNCPCSTSTVSNSKKNSLLIGKNPDNKFKCKTCIGCVELNVGVREFKERYPTLLDTDKDYEQILEYFLNNTLNLNQTYGEYKKLAEQCMAGISDIDEDHVIDDFYNYHKELSVDIRLGSIYDAPPIQLWEMAAHPLIISEEPPVKSKSLDNLSINNYNFSWSFVSMVNENEADKENNYPSLVSLNKGWITQKNDQNLATKNIQNAIRTKLRDIALNIEEGNIHAFEEVETPNENIDGDDGCIGCDDDPNPGSGGGSDPDFPDPPEDDPPASDNKDLTTCGCDKIFDVWRANPNKTDEELAAIFATTYNNGVPLPDFAKLKELCCISFNGFEIDPATVPPGTGDTNPTNDGGQGGGNPEEENPPPPPIGGLPPSPFRPGEPCTITFPSQGPLIWSDNAKAALKKNANQFDFLGFPSGMNCNDPELSNTDICGCDQLIIFENQNNESGSPLPFKEYVISQTNFNGALSELDLDAILALCKSIKYDLPISGQWSTAKAARLFDETSNPEFKLPKEFGCGPPPPPPPPVGICPTCSGGTPFEPCTTLTISCSQFAALVKAEFGGDGRFLNNQTLTAYQQMNGGAKWNNLINTFKAFLGLPLADCNTGVFRLDIVQNEDQCGLPRAVFTGGFLINKDGTGSTDYYTEVLKAISRFGCGCTEPGAWEVLTPRTATACNDCFGPTRKLLAIQGFFNTLTSNSRVISTSRGVVKYNKFHSYFPQAINPSSEFAKAFDLQGSIQHAWNINPPFVNSFYKMEITASGGFSMDLELNFPSNSPLYKIYFVRRFFNIRPMCPYNMPNGNPEYFYVDVELDVYHPYATTRKSPSRMVVSVTGKIQSLQSVVVGKKFNCCAKLCNKPAIPKLEEDPCNEQLEITAIQNATYNYTQYIDNLRSDFRRKYLEKCLQSSNSNSFQEHFKMKYNNGEYHYTLYYYDQAGNLVQTLPPEAVKPYTSSASIDAIIPLRETDQALSPRVPVVPPHNFNLATRYLYNSLNQLIWQKTPDAGESVFYYDDLGRIIFSQNAAQSAQSNSNGYIYSYTRYDALGRITEVGQLKSPIVVTHANCKIPTSLAQIYTGSKKEITKTYYDIAVQPNAIVPFTQQNLRNRVSMSTFQQAEGNTIDYGIFYNYDIHGNVKTLGRLISTLSNNDFDEGFKTTTYYYDLLSGKVNGVIYQKDQKDQYIHLYGYDKQNRLVEVKSGSRYDNLEQDATYQYYLHGPLARMELGAHLVQGVDYSYTLNGWLKGVNGVSLYPGRDIGRDGFKSDQTFLHENVAKDEFGFTLDYFNGDYEPIRSATSSAFKNFMIENSGTNSILNATRDLYNGNIKMMTTAIKQLMNTEVTPLASVYNYDQLNRIAKADYYNSVNMLENKWVSSDPLAAWHNRFTYDANGNILQQVRRSDAANAGSAEMDSLLYEYYPNTNKLKRVSDWVSKDKFTDDIDDQEGDNYTYDEIGNLISDKAEEIENIEWSVYGKILKIKRYGWSTKPDLEFAYTPDGHRVMKLVIPKSKKATNLYTYYVRDAQGNILATYERTFTKTVDYSRLTYAQVRDKMLETSDPSAIANFLAWLHHHKLPNAQLNDVLVNDLVNNPNHLPPFLQSQNPQHPLKDNIVNPLDVLNTYSPVEIYEMLEGQYGGSPIGTWNAICNCMQSRLIASGNNSPSFLSWLLDDVDGIPLLLEFMENHMNEKYNQLFSQLELPLYDLQSNINRLRNHIDGNPTRKQDVINILLRKVQMNEPAHYVWLLHDLQNSYSKLGSYFEYLNTNHQTVYDDIVGQLGMGTTDPQYAAMQLASYIQIQPQKYAQTLNEFKTKLDKEVPAYMFQYVLFERPENLEHFLNYLAGDHKAWEEKAYSYEQESDYLYNKILNHFGLSYTTLPADAATSITNWAAANSIDAAVRIMNELMPQSVQKEIGVIWAFKIPDGNKQLESLLQTLQSYNLEDYGNILISVGLTPDNRFEDEANALYNIITSADPINIDKTASLENVLKELLPEYNGSSPFNYWFLNHNAMGFERFLEYLNNNHNQLYQNLLEAFNLNIYMGDDEATSELLPFIIDERELGINTPYNPNFTNPIESNKVALAKRIQHGEPIYYSAYHWLLAGFGNAGGYYAESNLSSFISYLQQNDLNSYNTLLEKFGAPSGDPINTANYILYNWGANNSRTVNAAVLIMSEVFDYNHLVAATQQPECDAMKTFFQQMLDYNGGQFTTRFRELLTRSLTPLPDIGNCEINSPTRVVNALTAKPWPDVWTRILGINSDATIWANYYKQNRTEDFLRTMALQHPQLFTNFQQSQNLYGGNTPNGMKAYFDYIKDYFGPSYHDALLKLFYNESSAYADSITLKEWMIYGSQRLGINDGRVLMMHRNINGTIVNGEIANAEQTWVDPDEPDMNETALMRGNKNYELTNHLGNVLVVVSDKRVLSCGHTILNQTFNSSAGVFNGGTGAAASTLSIVGGRLRVLATPALSGTRTTLTTVPGKTYSVKYYYQTGTTTSPVECIIKDISANTDLITKAQNTTGNYEFTFTATGTSVLVLFEKSGNAGTATDFYLDDISVRAFENGAEVLHATDYSPFGAPLPGRSGFVTNGRWILRNSSLAAGINIPQNLSITNRNNNTPREYIASQWAELAPGFESSTTDEFVLYVTSNASTGNGLSDACLPCAGLKALVQDYEASFNQTFSNQNLELFVNYVNQRLGTLITIGELRKALDKCAIATQTLTLTQNLQKDIRFSGTNRHEGLNFGTQPFTTEAWVNITGNAYQTIMSNLAATPNWNGFSLWTWDGYLFFTVADGAGFAQVKSIAPVLAANTWYHVAAVRKDNNASDFKLYVNGQEINSVADNYVTLTNGQITGQSDLRIGSYQYNLGNGGTDYFGGQIRNARVYKRMLGQSEIAANYSGGCITDPKVLDNLVFYARLNEGEGATIHDYGSMGSTGKYSGDAETDWSMQTQQAYNSCYDPSAIALCVKRDGGYRFGFNGKEKDDEVVGAGNCIAYEERIYDPRLGRFNSTDPRQKEYAWQSTYAYYGNSPISTIDFLGMGGPYDPDAAGEITPEVGSSTSTMTTPPAAGATNSSTSLPVYTIFEEKTPGIYNNAKNALTMHPEWSTLTYNGGGQAATNNRRLACPPNSCVNTNQVMSCEEFPMASTTQGGAGAFTSCVPIQEQWSQGGTLSQMYQQNNMKAGDQFRVVIVPKLKMPQPSPVPSPVVVPENKTPQPVNPPFVPLALPARILDRLKLVPILPIIIIDPNIGVGGYGGYVPPES